MAVSALAVSAFAQGTVTFANATGQVKQWTASDSTVLINVPKNGGSVQLIAAPAAVALANPLGVLGAQGFAPTYTTLASFLSANPGWAAVAVSPLNTAAGLFNGGTQTIANIGLAASAHYMLIGWTGAANSYDAAVLAGTAFAGASSVFTTATADPIGPPPGTPVNLNKSFVGVSLAPLVVPEPTSFALAGLGLAALLVFRRRS